MNAQQEEVLILDATAKGVRLARRQFQWVTLGLMLGCVVATIVVIVVQPFNDSETQAIVPFILSSGAAMFGVLDRQFEIETLRQELKAEAAGRTYYEDLIQSETKK